MLLIGLGDSLDKTGGFCGGKRKKKKNPDSVFALIHKGFKRSETSSRVSSE
jgi:hypothetical protein